ncbi:MAG: alpha/beta fold hydrolase [Solirubrobacteraceae bacterium]
MSSIEDLPAELPAVPGVSHRWVTLSALRMHVAEAGAGEPLLLVHGWPQHWWSFRFLIGELAERFRVIVPDLRGLGWSEAPAGDYAKAEFAADLLELLDHEGIERAAVMGHDWGGYASFLLALEHPARVSRLIALDIPPPWAARPQPRQLALPFLASYQVLLATPVGRRLLERRPGLVRSIIRLATGPSHSWTREELDCYALRLCEPPRAAASSAIYRTFLTRELPATLRRGDRSAELSVPTLLLMGQNSMIDRILVPRAAGMLQVRRVSQAGHFLPEEAPRAVLDAARDWFD